MIRLGLRLTLQGGREAATRLIVIVAAVLLGVGLLLATLAGINAVNSQNARYAWLETGAGGAGHAASSTADPVWWKLTADQFHGKTIGRVDVAPTGSTSPVPPGIARLPGPGEYYASPALSSLLRSTPADQLAARYPGRQIGTIGSSALPAPNSLVIVVGRTPGQMAAVHGATEVTAISTTVPSSCSGDCYFIGIDARGIDLILSVVTAALLFPVLVFIGVATRLSAARREQRFAAMRLVGATPRQVAMISTVESTVAAAIGVAAGFGLFFALRPALAPIPFTGDPFFLGDLSLNLIDVLVVALGIPVAAAVAARLALRRVFVSPLGVSRRIAPRPPRAWRLIPLFAGLAELGYFAAAGRPASTPGQIQAFLPGILVTMAGLVLAGPWLTSVGARLIAHRARRPATLVAARRLSDNPQAGFRAISGLVLALFVTSVAVGVITTMNAYGGGSQDTAADRATLIDDFTQYSPGGPTTSVRSLPSAVLAELNTVPGVQAVTTIHRGTATTSVSTKAGSTRVDIGAGIASCADLARTPALGRCRPGAQAAAIEPNLIGSRFADAVWPAASVPTGQRLAALPVRALAVATDGSSGAVEQARTVLEAAFSDRYTPSTVAELRAQSANTKRTAMYQQLADVVILTSLPIAGCTLAVSVIAGLNDRRRPFSLLRLTGAPLRMLRRVVALESAAPLLILAAVAIGTGFLTAYLFLRSQMGYMLQAPGLAYYLVVVAGLLASLAIIASTLTALNRITGPEVARNE
ncbi:MAG: FtsX-like permease family protein [Jatrophihabitantaceae bacterium]